MGAGGGGGFFQGALQTAAGVAAGALAFQGVESLMHGFGHAAGYGQDFSGFGGSERPTEVINNYYGDDRGEHGVSGDERSMGDQVDKDFGQGSNSSNDRDSLYGSGVDSGSGQSNDSGFGDDGSNFDDSSFSDGSGDFGDDGSGGGDDSSF